LIVIASSPLIDSRTLDDDRVRTLNERASEISASGLPVSGLKAEVRRRARQRWRGDVPGLGSAVLVRPFLLRTHLYRRACQID
jgi:hypothetical protein